MLFVAWPTGAKERALLSGLFVVRRSFKVSSTTIRYKKGEFVANDLPIEVWLFEVSTRIENDVAPWLNEMKEEWRLQATEAFDFGPTPALDIFLTTTERQQIVVSLFDRTMNELVKRRNPFTPDELYHKGIGGREVVYSVELPVQTVVDVGKQFLSLISCNLPQQY